MRLTTHSGLDMRVAVWSLNLDELDSYARQVGTVALLIYLLRRSGQKHVAGRLKGWKETIKIW